MTEKGIYQRTEVFDELLITECGGLGILADSKLDEYFAYGTGYFIPSMFAILAKEEPLATVGNFVWVGEDGIVNRDEKLGGWDI